MTLMVPLNSDLERRLAQEAARRGVGPGEYAARLIEEHLPPPRRGSSLTQLFSEWDAEDQTSDSGEISRRNQEFEELKRQLNMNREESEGPYSRKPFPDSR